MKHLILIVLFLFSVSLFSQNQNVYKRITCEDGIEQAILDASKGEYKLISYGLMISFEDYGFGEFYSDFVYKKFEILLSNGGCVIMPDTKCYREKIEELIFEKYGKDIFVNAKEAARIAFKNTFQYKDIVKKKIDSGFVFPSTLVHKKPKFIGGEKELEIFLSRSVNPEDWFEFDNYLRAFFIVEKDGRVSNIELVNADDNQEIDNAQSKEILEILKEMPKWEPGKYFNELVRTRESLKIVIK